MWPTLVPTVGLFASLGAGLWRLLWPEQSSSGHSEPPQGPAWYPHWSDPTPGTSAAKQLLGPAYRTWGPGQIKTDSATPQPAGKVAQGQVCAQVAMGLLAFGFGFLSW